MRVSSKGLVCVYEPMRVLDITVLCHAASSLEYREPSNISCVALLMPREKNYE